MASAGSDRGKRNAIARRFYLPRACANSYGACRAFFQAIAGHRDMVPETATNNELLESPEAFQHGCVVADGRSSELHDNSTPIWKRSQNIARQGRIYDHVNRNTFWHCSVNQEIGRQPRRQ
jgi:hypothetical protein